MEIVKMNFCKNCTRLILEVKDYVIDCFTENDILVSHIFFLAKNDCSFQTYSIYSDSYHFIPCVYVESDVVLYFCAALQWQSSD